MTQQYLNRLSYKVIGAAIEVHKQIGSGLLESIYHQCMMEELRFSKIKFITEMKLPLQYKNLRLSVDFRCDLFIEDCLLVELKAANEFHPLFEAQLLTYMKLLKAPKGLLINFNCANIYSHGLKTFVNEYFSQLPKF